MNKDSLKLFIKYLINFTLIVIIVTLIGFVLLYLSYLLPTDRMIQNISSDSTFIENYSDNILFNNNLFTVNFHTDSLMKNTAICKFYDSNIYNTLLNPHFSYYDSYLVHQDYGRVTPDLLRYLSGDNNVYILYYARYWNGYLIFLKPLLLLFNNNSLQMLEIIIGILLSIVLLILIFKDNVIYGLASLLLMIYINPITASMTLQLHYVYVITVLSCIYVLINRDKIFDKKYMYVFVIIGALIAYFDLLTYELIAWALPLIVLIINSNDSKKNIIVTIQSGMSWLFGYGFMWFNKWLLANIFTNENVIQNGLDEAYLRSNPLNTVGVNSFTYSETLTSLFNYCGKYFLIIAICLITIVIVNSYIKKEKIRINKKYLYSIICYIIIFVIPFFWFLLVRNHSATHPILETRHLVMSLASIFVITYKMFNREKKSD